MCGHKQKTPTLPSYHFLEPLYHLQALPVPMLFCFQSNSVTVYLSSLLEPPGKSGLAEERGGPG